MKRIFIILVMIVVFQHGYSSTPLHRASYRGYFKKVYLALRNGAEIEEPDSKGRTALFYAIYQSSSFQQRNKYRIARYLLNKGADANRSDNAGRTPLHEAIRYRSKKIALLLIQRGARLNSRDDMGSTPLHEAARNGMTGIARFMIAKGADVNVRDKSGWTPLHEAASKRRHRTVKMLLRNKADSGIINEDGNSPLHLACGENNIITVVYLLRSSVKYLNYKNIYGKTPLFYAVRLGSIKITGLLLSKGASINEKDYSGFTPLFYTARTKNVKMTKFLLKNGADIRYKNSRGVTPVHYAAQMGNEKMIKLLLKNGADPDSKTAAGLTYLDIVKKTSYLFQNIKCDKKLPLLYLSYMEGKHSATSYYTRRPYRYSVEKCFDKNINTCWIEGDRGSGIGEKIAFYSEKEIRFLSVFPGHGNIRLFRMHNRLHRARVSIYENMYQQQCKYKFGKKLNSIDITFEDSPRKKKFPVKVNRESANGYIIVIEIRSVYRGTKWKNDTCIAEVETI